MLRYVITSIILFLSMLSVEGQERNVVVADSETRMPLPNASIFDRHGKTIGMSNARGRIPAIPSDCYPINVRYLGFKEKTVRSANTDTIFLKESISELPEVLVESRNRIVLHIIAYIREYSTMATYSDSVFLFREKKVDYMLTPDKKMRFKGWSNPRVLTCKSYYRFTNGAGLDSVSDESRHHFSWSDWVGIAPVMKLPAALRKVERATDTVRGKYGMKEIWMKNNDQVAVNVDVLADTTARKWVPDISGFFHEGLDFEHFKLHLNYEDVTADSVTPLDLKGYSFNIESNGRGHNMFRFNRTDEPLFVNTYAEVYILDKRFITVKEAKKWASRELDTDEISIYQPSDLPELQASIQTLIDRVNNINKGQIRLEVEPDTRLVSKYYGRRKPHIGHRALYLLKEVTGITLFNSRRNFNRRWDEFKKKTRQLNQTHTQQPDSTSTDHKSQQSPAQQSPDL